MNSEHIIERVIKIRIALPAMQANAIDFEHNPVPPFVGAEETKLLVVGQDPTINNSRERENIKCTLNLNRRGPLRNYINKICSGLGLSLENIYATNLYKYFYSTPPARTFEVLCAHKEPNIKLLKEEAALFRGCPIITLGEPVLRLIAGDKAKVKSFWGYYGCGYHHIAAEDSILGGPIFPFPHLRSMGKDFYKMNLEGYLNYMREQTSE